MSCGTPLSGGTLHKYNEGMTLEFFPKTELYEMDGFIVEGDVTALMNRTRSGDSVVDSVCLHNDCSQLVYLDEESLVKLKGEARMRLFLIVGSELPRPEPLND